MEKFFAQDCELVCWHICDVVTKNGNYDVVFNRKVMLGPSFAELFEYPSAYLVSFYCGFAYFFADYDR